MIYFDALDTPAQWLASWMPMLLPEVFYLRQLVRYLLTRKTATACSSENSFRILTCSCQPHLKDYMKVPLWPGSAVRPNSRQAVAWTTLRFRKPGEPFSSSLLWCPTLIWLSPIWIICLSSLRSKPHRPNKAVSRPRLHLVLTGEPFEPAEILTDGMQSFKGFGNHLGPWIPTPIGNFAKRSWLIHWPKLFPYKLRGQNAPISLMRLGNAAITNAAFVGKHWHRPTSFINLTSWPPFRHGGPPAAFIEPWFMDFAHSCVSKPTTSKTKRPTKRDRRTSSKHWLTSARPTSTKLLQRLKMPLPMKFMPASRRLAFVLQGERNFDHSPWYEMLMEVLQSHALISTASGAPILPTLKLAALSSLTNYWTCATTQSLNRSSGQMSAFSIIFLPCAIWKTCSGNATPTRRLGLTTWSLNFAVMQPNGSLIIWPHSSWRSGSTWRSLFNGKGGSFLRFSKAKAPWTTPPATEASWWAHMSRRPFTTSTGSPPWSNLSSMLRPCNLEDYQAKEWIWLHMESGPFSTLPRHVENLLRCSFLTSSRPITAWSDSWRLAQRVPIPSCSNCSRRLICPRMWSIGYARPLMSHLPWAALIALIGSVRQPLSSIATLGITSEATLPWWPRIGALDLAMAMLTYFSVQSWAECWTSCKKSSRRLDFVSTSSGMATSHFWLALARPQAPRPWVSLGLTTLLSWSGMVQLANFWKLCPSSLRLSLISSPHEVSSSTSAKARRKWCSCSGAQDPDNYAGTFSTALTPRSLSTLTPWARLTSALWSSTNTLATPCMRMAIWWLNFAPEWVTPTVLFRSSVLRCTPTGFVPTQAGCHLQGLCPIHLHVEFRYMAPIAEEWVHLHLGSLCSTPSPPHCSWHWP